MSYLIFFLSGGRRARRFVLRTGGFIRFQSRWRGSLVLQITLLALSAGLLATSGQAAQTSSDTASFAQSLQFELRRNVERLHHSFAAEREKNQKHSEFYMPFLLSGLTNLHARTGEAVLLDWAKENLMWLVRSAQDAEGRATPLFGSQFRFLGAFCDAYRHLQTHNALTPAEATEVQAQIIANATARMDRADFGAQNRGLIYGAELLFCADAVPTAPGAERWRRYGEAL